MSKSVKKAKSKKPQRRKARFYWPYALMILSVIIAIVSSIFARWTMALTLDATHSYISVPSISQWTLPSIIVFGSSIFGALISVIAAAIDVARHSTKPIE